MSFMSLAWLTGPVFGKELRVSARRRRLYLIRFFYIAALMVFAAMIYLKAVPNLNVSARGISRMPEVGKEIINSVLWFQFFASQFLAVVIMSTSISSEVYNRTLPILKVTPITDFQIVSGKVLGGMVQILILLACSLPVLALIRVFGGVPWGNVVAGLCITACTAMLAGAVAVRLSAMFSRTYIVILMGFATMLLYHGVTILMSWGLTSVATLLSSAGMMLLNSDQLFTPSGAWQMLLWPMHCLIILGVSFFLIWKCSRLINGITLPGQSGSAGILLRRPVPTGDLEALARLSLAKGETPWTPHLSIEPKISDSPPPATHPENPAERVKRKVAWIKSSPLFWMETRTPFFRNRLSRILIVALSVIINIWIISYALMFFGTFALIKVHAVYITTYLLIGMALTAVLSATTVAVERQSGTWLLLLTTPISDWHILLVKASAVIYRARLFWGLFFGHILFFTLFGMIHPIAILHLLILFLWVNALLLGAGMYMGVRLRVAGHAVIANCALALGLWVIIPTMLSLVSGIGGPQSQIRPLRQLHATYQQFNPVVQGWTLTEGAAGPFSADRNRGLEYHWPRGHAPARDGSVWQATRVVFWSILIYGVAAAILAWRAVRNFRKLAV